ncbi:hypothetical protein DOTSEDRAFT_173239 [Dothistroma septosporum NZE10]|uniref:Origin recognition complex subunit 2 n=1 Tax=Dothistroma septosporum (strain NZE10 / CBS 128990) TaxID=675120 RepID=M2XJW7_DOTSN|nr:hypothetical protein DOTSEDRAFT_173239 [Dothistroma septosporum NZE10]
MPRKRKADDGLDDDDSTPRKSARRSARANDDEAAQSPGETPSRRKGILKDATPSKANWLKNVEATPVSMRKVLFATPKGDKEDVNGDDEDTPTAARNDRSARRKSGRVLQKQIAKVDDSDEEQDERDETIAQAILGEEEDEEDAGDEIEVNASSAPDTPSKTGRPRGRPKGKRRERTPSPPPNLPSHELYFFQNRAGGNKTSANTLPSQLLLNHEDYFNQIKDYKDPHTTDIERLKQLHKRAFDQWIFELEEEFNICLYGYGSKRKLLVDFATHVHRQSEKPPKIVVVNGYTPNLTVRDILTTVAGVTLSKSTKLPAQPQALLELLLLELISPITLLINSLDHSNLRKSSTQTIIASLAAHPQVSLVATCDTPNFPLLWPTNLTTQFRFLFHDATTFEPYTAELEVVEDVNALLGRSSRRLGGKDGVGYVLKSLPENARRLFGILVAEQMALADTDLDAGGRPPKKKKPVNNTPKKQAQAAVTGVEYRTLYHKAVEDFICSSEVNFRTLLKEFHDHQMIESRKDAMGTERLTVPFRREELEAILEELV